ncbi:MAG: pilus assembly protein TadG-related protein [Actinomycetota bacterium]|nr:pilus assembly protein TadG-related protein [Actinomycetota bacterium]
MGRSSSEAGFVTVWVLGLTIMMLAIAGVTIDFWRAVATQRSVSSVVDSAAIAGSSGIDEAAFRASGGKVVQLDPARARALAQHSLASQPEAARLVDTAIDVTPARITVTAGRQLEFTLVRVLQPGEAPAVLHATSTVDARRAG